MTLKMSRSTGSILLCLLMMAILSTGALAQNWTVGGGSVRNDRNASSEKSISAGNVGGLALKWAFTTQGDVSATPTVEGKVAYVVDWGGWVHAVDTDTGSARWSVKLSTITGSEPSISRTSPAIYKDLVIIGDQGDLDQIMGFPAGNYKTASVIALNKNTGALVWRTVVDSHPFSAVTSSPVVSGKTLVVGVCSLEEAAGFIPGWQYFFRGKVVALDASNGSMIWQTYMVPPGYTGGAVWGGTPAVDDSRKSVYVATGNNYSVPPAVEAQIAADPANGESYLAADDYIDAVLSLDLKTGAIKWGKRLQGADTWNVVRDFTPDQFDPGQGPDYDFGSGPNLFTAKVGGNSFDLVGAGQKSGRYWALNPDTGAVVWMTQVGPGGLAGGIQWGSATDGTRVYVAVSNNDGKPYTTLNGETKSAGLWAGLNAATGAYIWQTPDPLDGRDYGMVTVANDVVFAGSNSGHMYAMNAVSGQVLWSFNSGGTVMCGPSVVRGTVYWGSGYGRFGGAFGGPGANNKLYAFYLP